MFIYSERTLFIDLKTVEDKKAWEAFKAHLKAKGLNLVFCEGEFPKISLPVNYHNAGVSESLYYDEYVCEESIFADLANTLYWEMN